MRKCKMKLDRFSRENSPSGAKINAKYRPSWKCLNLIIIKTFLKHLVSCDNSVEKNFEMKQAFLFSFLKKPGLKNEKLLTLIV